MHGFPTIGRDILHQLRALSTAEPHEYHAYPPSLAAAESAGRICEAAGWDARPTWDILAAGGRPPEPPPQQVELSDWTHGWQYHAALKIEASAFGALMQTLGRGERSPP